MVTHPSTVDVRSYDVGFGDCFLLSFGYGSGGTADARHLLIDFGTNKGAPRGPKLDAVAERIRADTGGKLHAVVLTHRHRDHLSGFDPSTGGEVIEALRPEAILRPWTERPSGTGPAPTHAQQALLDTVSLAHDIATSIGAIQWQSRRAVVAQDLMSLAGLQLRNSDAIAVLDRLAGDHGLYLRYGDEVDLGDLLPGVRIRVLGPPDPEVYPAIGRQASNSSEYWLGSGLMGLASLADLQVGGRRAVIGAEGDAAAVLQEPGPVRWLMDHLDEHQPRSTLRLVHTLDRVLNNTSLILLIEAAGRRMLFPGDAQVENWRYALEVAPDHEANRDLLRSIDLYKVGHHGSRNATPRQALFSLWDGNLPVSVMSTLGGVYDQGNDVPNQALVDALGARLERTDALRLDPDDPAGRDEPVLHLAASRTSGFTRVPG
jgi:glyoxylase-like metal-dependent hydrolase (beta-lactamase superfamily II)